MSNVPELKAKVKLDGASAMVAGLKGISPEVVELGKKLSGLAGPLAAIAAGGYLIVEVFRKTVEGLKEATALGEELAHLSAQTGMSAGSLALLRKEFTGAGVDAGSVGARINLMQRAIAGISETGESTARVFAELRLNVAELRRLSPEEQFTKITAAIAGIPNAARQADAAMKIFGRGGAEMLPLIKNPDAMKDAKWALGDSAKLLEEDAAPFERIAGLFSNIGDKFRSFFIGVMDQLGPALLPILEAFNKIDLTELGQLVGELLKLVVLPLAALAQVFNTIFDGLNRLGIIRDPLPVKSAPGQPVAGGLNGIEGQQREKQSDRLARIGGFIGNTANGGPLSAIERYTAQTVQKLGAIHQLIVEKSWGISPHAAPPASAWH